MFDDLNKTINNNAKNKSAGAPKDDVMPISNAGDKQTPISRPVEDIFSGTDKKAMDSQPDKPAVLQPKAKEPTNPVLPRRGNEAGESTVATSIGDIKKYLMLGAMAAGLLLIGLAGYWAYNSYFKIAPVNQEEIGSKIGEPVSDGPAEAGQQPVETPKKQEKKEVKQIPIKPKDSDQDGLTDEEEKELGTDINNVDTDDDGLFDREEVQVYKTDPLNADSDSDGYLDGEEVKAGYNPMGPGMLYEIN